MTVETFLGEYVFVMIILLSMYLLIFYYPKRVIMKLEFNCTCGCKKLEKVEISCVLVSTVELEINSGTINEISSSELEIKQKVFDHYRCFSCSQIYSANELIEMHGLDNPIHSDLLKKNQLQSEKYYEKN